MVPGSLVGQIGLIPKGDGLVPEGIEFFTKSPVYHAIVCVDPDWIIEAQPGGAALNPIATRSSAIWSHYDLSETQAEQIAGWAKLQRGVPYNWIDDAALGLWAIFGNNVPNFVARRLSSGKTLQCAQLADAALQAGGIHVFKDRLPGAVFPGSFVPIFKERGWWTLP